MPYPRGAYHIIQKSCNWGTKRPPRSFKRRQPFKFSKYASCETSYKPPPYHSSSKRGVCHKYGRKEHFAKACRTPPYLVMMYKELHNLRIKQKDTHALDVPSFFELDTDNYMVFNNVIPTSTNIALLDNASTPTILCNKKIFIFLDNNISW